MIESDYFDEKRRQLGMDRQDVLESVQALLEQWYPGRVRARQLHQGVLRLVTPSASVASELRLRQVELRDAITPRLAGEPLDRIAIQIGVLG